jgi:hypothetical protein
MNVSDFAYFKVSLGGSANRLIYFRVPIDKIEEVNREFEGFEDRSNGGHYNWTDNAMVHMKGVAMDWADRTDVAFLP